MAGQRVKRSSQACVLGLLSGWEEVSGGRSLLTPVRIAESDTHRGPPTCLGCPERHHAEPLFSCLLNGGTVHSVHTSWGLVRSAPDVYQHISASAPSWAVLTAGVRVCPPAMTRAVSAPESIPAVLTVGPRDRRREQHAGLLPWDPLLEGSPAGVGTLAGPSPPGCCRLPNPRRRVTATKHSAVVTESAT